VNNLHDAAFTAEGWFKSIDLPGSYNYIICKGSPTEGGLYGWNLLFTATAVRARVDAATTDSEALYTTAVPQTDNTWHHFAMTFDDAGDRRVRLYMDRVLVATAAAAAVGDIRSDAAVQLGIGNYGYLSKFIHGSVGWVRISNVVRDIVNEAQYTRRTPPASDASTVRLFRMDDGTGTAITDTSPNAINGVSTGVTWLRDGYG
jgi:hypothetical protein